jgi:hypothetical protein
MSAKLSLHAGQESVWLKSKRFSRVLKMAAAAFAILYLINSAGAAAGYASALRMGPDGSEQQVADAIWVGVAWPIVLHDKMRTDPLQRVGPPSKLGS